MSTDTALVVIDVQVGLMADAYHCNDVLTSINTLLSKARASDSFYATSLQQELEARGIKHLVVVGGQTEYCIDTSVRRATTMGYTVTLVGDAHTTDDYEEAVLSAAKRIECHNEVLDGFRTDDHVMAVQSTREVTF